MKYRPQRGSLQEAMDRQVVLDDTVEALAKHLELTLEYGFSLDKLNVVPYKLERDERIDWHETWAVHLGDNIIGYTDSGPTQWWKLQSWRNEFEKKAAIKSHYVNRVLVTTRKPDGSYDHPWVEWAWRGFLMAKEK